MCIVTDPKIDIPKFKLNIIIKHMEFTAQWIITMDHNNGASIGLTQILENLK